MPPKKWNVVVDGKQKRSKMASVADNRGLSKDLWMKFVWAALLIIVIIVILSMIKFVRAEKIDRDEPFRFSLSVQVEGRSLTKDIDILVTYSDPAGAVRIRTVKSLELSASWVLKTPSDDNNDQTSSSGLLEDQFQSVSRSEDSNVHLTDEHSAGGEMPHSDMSIRKPLKLRRRMLREKKKKQQTEKVIKVDNKTDSQMQAAAIEQSKEFDSIWRKEYENPNSDSILKLMRDEIIMARAYASIARAKNKTNLYSSLIKHARKSESAIGQAALDAELNPSAFDRAKEMGHALSLAKDQLYDCITFERKLRTILQFTEANVNAAKSKSTFLIQLAAKTVPKELHCLPVLLTTEYYLKGYENRGFPSSPKLEDPLLYHYAIFSDNVLATSVVVNSTVLHANEPGKHVFHIVTDRLNFAAMKMWFLVNPPAGATIQVENVDDFTWLNSYYCPALSQLESARMIEYNFKADQASSFTAVPYNLKYRNPKYLSLLNHLRFYLPEVYPKLDKILFLDDDIVVQKDLTPLWSVDLQGMVNGAVETCKESFNRFNKYLNFSNPKISKNFDPNACGWAFGMNIFDLKEWKRRDITGIYHHWQHMNEDRTLCKLGTLPQGLMTFYNLTYPLDRSWHVLGLGYDPVLNQTEIENAAVIHYNGNYKPWLDIAITKYKSYWSRYVMFDNPYVRLCNLVE